jgi:hypothetical protein
LDDKVVQRNLEDLACFIQRFNGVQYAFLKIFQKELFKKRDGWDISTPERLSVLAKDHIVSSGKFEAMFVKKGEALDSAIVASIEAFFMGDKLLKTPFEKFFGGLKLNSNSLDMGIEKNELDFNGVNIPKARNRYVWVPFFKNSIGNYISVEWSNFDCYDISFFFFKKTIIRFIFCRKKLYFFFF